MGDEGGFTRLNLYYLLLIIILIKLYPEILLKFFQSTQKMLYKTINFLCDFSVIKICQYYFPDEFPNILKSECFTIYRNQFEDPFTVLEEEEKLSPLQLQGKLSFFALI